MKQTTITTRPCPRAVFVITDEAGQEYSCNTNESEARYNGELMAEFSPDQSFYLVPHTLH